MLASDALLTARLESSALDEFAGWILLSFDGSRRRSPFMSPFISAVKVMIWGVSRMLLEDCSRLIMFATTWELPVEAEPPVVLLLTTELPLFANEITPLFIAALEALFIAVFAELLELLEAVSADALALLPDDAAVEDDVPSLSDGRAELLLPVSVFAGRAGVGQFVAISPGSLVATIFLL